MKTTRFTTKKPCPTCNVYTSRLLTSDETRQAEFHACYPATRPELPGVYYSNGHCKLACRGCGTMRTAEGVRGKFSAAHECNAKCLSSHGFVCECSCGGKNHGAGHAA